MVCDVVSDESVKAAIAEVLAKAGRIDLLVNNAGVGLIGAAEESSIEQAKALLRSHGRQLDALVEALLKRETLDEKEILEVTGLPPAPALESSRVVAAAGGEPERGGAVRAGRGSQPR